MDEVEVKERVATAAGNPIGAIQGAQPSTSPTDPALSTQAGNSSCPSCEASGEGTGSPVPPTYVYAIGKIDPRFPRVSVEKEFAQVIGRNETGGLTDRQALHKVLSQRKYRYLARQLCWVMTVEGLQTYILVPRDPVDLDLLVETLRPNPKPADLDVVIGLKGPIAPPEMCNGLMIPIVAFDQIYSFDREALIKAIPRHEKTAAKEFSAAAEELFDRIMQITDNAGATDEYRALNYLAVRYHAIYAKVAERFAMNCSLTRLDVRPSALSGIRKIVDVILSFTNRNTDVTEKFFCRVDVTEELPFLVKKLSQYVDR